MPRPHRSPTTSSMLTPWLICFRGSIAPASSKPGAAQNPEGPIAAFPGLYCPGLIEARRRGSATAVGIGVSGALLPRPHRSGNGCRMVQPFGNGFRGSIAPASSKPDERYQKLKDKSLFPGLYCPGLIEAGWAGLPRPPRYGFRGSIAPASSKRNPSPAGSFRMAMFPGLYCPGLIEAMSPISAGLIPTTSFRGSIAPASSKRVAAPRRGVPGLRFRGSIAPASSKRIPTRSSAHTRARVSGALLPRPHRSRLRCAPSWSGRRRFRGSIAPASSKPRRRGRRTPGEHRRFRGSIAPASSKRQRVSMIKLMRSLVSGALLPRPHRSTLAAGAAARDLRRFRGSIAPASSKPRNGRRPRGPSPGFPGLYCPGLIEARVVLSSSTPLPSVSGALLPRPHRSGLSLTRRAQGRRRFRGSIAPASSKRRSCYRLRHPYRRFRGSIAPASSKLRLANLRRFLVLGFRGSIAPASSKRATRWCCRRAVAGFRGSIAPASSKPARRRQRPLLHGRFPGLYCPGLIEAAPAS